MKGIIALMKKSPVHCTGNPETCETCISIREFVDRLNKGRSKKINMPLLKHLIEENKLMRDD